MAPQKYWPAETCGGPGTAGGHPRGPKVRTKWARLTTRLGAGGGGRRPGERYAGFPDGQRGGEGYWLPFSEVKPNYFVVWD